MNKIKELLDTTIKKLSDVPDGLSAEHSSEILHGTKKAPNLGP